MIVPCTGGFIVFLLCFLLSNIVFLQSYIGHRQTDQAALDKEPTIVLVLVWV